ncbi:EF-Hand 1, calcium-binding site,Destabilase [Cinara cedri]|uniref:lysozyme n=1 Tax=Cinara cedri TaxID=506608 RepID=A0A5E4MLJ9_9HEMI|nr:EF-Hand 1, calcium-binding site,Destabilase [Cinara cedri]
MKINLFFILGLTAVSNYGLVNAYPQTRQLTRHTIDRDCLGCICDAVLCNINIMCDAKRDTCGPYRIMSTYWIDAGRPVLQGDNPMNKLAYQRCVSDKTCAERTVRNYLTKYAQDCNGDGTINCQDYMSIHQLGGFACKSQLFKGLQDRFDQCQKRLIPVKENFNRPEKEANIQSNLPQLPPVSPVIKKGNEPDLEPHIETYEVRLPPGFSEKEKINRPEKEANIQSNLPQLPPVSPVIKKGNEPDLEPHIETYEEKINRPEKEANIQSNLPQLPPVSPVIKKGNEPDLEPHIETYEVRLPPGFSEKKKINRPEKEANIQSNLPQLPPVSPVIKKGNEPDLEPHIETYEVRLPPGFFKKR